MFVSSHRFTTPTLEFGGVRYATEEAGGWFRAVDTFLDRRVGFDTGDILLNGDLEHCLRLRTLHSDAGNINAWSYAWVYRKRSQIFVF